VFILSPAVVSQRLSTTKKWSLLTRSQPRVVNGPHFEARTRPEPDIYFWSPI